MLHVCLMLLFLNQETTTRLGRADLASRLMVSNNKYHFIGIQQLTPFVSLGLPLFKWWFVLGGIYIYAYRECECACAYLRLLIRACARVCAYVSLYKLT